MSGASAAVREVANDGVAVVGAGAVGVCCAIALARQGHRVTLIDPGPPGGAQAASHGNGGWISPASVVPMSLPGLWTRIPGLLADVDGPLTIRARALPELLPWLWRFLRAGSRIEAVEATSATLAVLLRDAPDRHTRLADEAGAGSLIHRAGLLYAYPSDDAWRADGLGWRLRQQQGVAWNRWTRDAAIASTASDATGSAEPAWPTWPAWLSARYRLAAHVPAGAHCSDPGAYVAALARHAQALNVQLLQTQVLGWQRGPNGRLQAVVTSEGSVRCQRAVLAAGIASAGLARLLGNRIPMTSERGYHLVLPIEAKQSPAWRTSFTAPLSVMPSDGRMALTPAAQGLRLAGQVELAQIDDPPDWRRADVLWRHAADSLTDDAWAATGLAAHRRDRVRPPSVPVWMGHRPSTPDGLPVIGACPSCPDVIYAFGHGHVGFASAPITADWVAQIIDSGAVRSDSDAARACAPERFS